MSYLNKFKTLVVKKLKNKKDNEDKVDFIDDEIKTNNLLERSENIINKNNDITNENMVTNSNQINNNNDNAKNIKINATPDDDPEEKLKELNDKYELLDFYDAPDSLGLETKVMPEYDEEKIHNEINEKHDNEYKSKVDRTQTKYDEDIKELIDLGEDKKVDFNQSKNQINDLYDNEIFNLENQAIKRGLSRSSIVIGELSKIENDRANALYSEYKKLNNDLIEIENKIVAKNTELDSALESLEIEKAEKIDAEIAKVYEDYKNAANEVIEFNNKVKKLEAEYKLDYEKAKAEHKEQILELTKYGYDEYRKRLELSKYNYMVSYLSQFSKNQAYEIFFSNNNFKELLGSNYSKVVDYLYNRT